MASSWFRWTVCEPWSLPKKMTAVYLVCVTSMKSIGTSYPANCQCLLPSFTISYTKTRVSWACPRATIPKPCLTIHHSNEPEHTMKQSSPCSSGIQSSSSPLASDKFGKKDMKTSFLGLKIIFDLPSLTFVFNIIASSFCLVISSEASLPPLKKFPQL